MYQKFFRTINICALALVLMIPQVASARNLYSIIAADTNDRSIGASVEQDFNHVRLKMQEIANYTGLDLKEISIKGKDTKPTVLLDALRKAQIKSDDVVVFYYSGHGYRTKKKGASPWPNLYFSTPDQGVKYETVMDLLKTKQPKFMLTIVDICNSYLPDNAAPPLVPRSSPIAPLLLKINYQRLFLESTGTIHVTSSSAGEYSYGYQDGGLYTNAFLRTLEASAQNAAPLSWSTILNKASSLVESQEHPYVELNI